MRRRRRPRVIKEDRQCRAHGCRDGRVRRVRVHGLQGLPSGEAVLPGDIAQSFRNKGRITINANSRIDWDCDNTPDEVNVKANINKDRKQVSGQCQPVYEPPLRTRNEWDYLDFRYGTIGTQLGALPEYPEVIVSEDPELPVDEILQIISPSVTYLPVILKK